jgi:hypothetical protein
MAINIDHSFVRQFGDNLELTSRQMGSKLRAGVTEKKVRGKDFTVERLTDANDTLSVVTSRHADTSISDMTHSRRTGFLYSYVRSVMLDDEDKIRMLIDPTSDYVKQLAGELNRTVDDRIIEATLGNAAAGETGGTTVALPAAQQIAAGGTGLTVAKLKQARKILMASDVDIEREGIILATNAAGWEDLASETGLNQFDFYNFRPNIDGQVPMAVGFQIVHAERLTSYTGTSASSSSRPALVICKSALHLGVSMDQLVDVSREPLKNLNYLITLKTAFGATRVHDDKVIDIRFAE